LGEGAYGTVNLAIDKKSGEVLAVKAVNIMKICQLNKERHIFREKELLESVKDRHPGIINLITTFKVSLLIISGRCQSLFCFRTRRKWKSRRSN
jgi:serine/threonine protein kinase